jgi:RND family efflux transporter MFP subunit
MTFHGKPVVRFAILAVAFGVSVAGCSSEPVAENKKPEVIKNVAVIVAQKTTIPDWLEAIGTVQAAQKTVVASQATGNIVEIRAREGDRVASGQILAVIDDTQPRAMVAQATAAVAAAQNEVSVADSNFSLAEATLKRYQQLYDKKSVSPQEFDEIKTRYASAGARRDLARAEQERANAALAQAQTSLGYTRVRAPFAGVVTQKLTDVGTLATPGMPIFTVEDTRRYRLEAAVDENDIGLVHAGAQVPIAIDSLDGSPLSGKVVQVFPAADPSSRSFVVKIELPSDARLRAGLFGRVRFLRGQRAALLIPRSSAFQRGQLEGVYVVDRDGIATLRYVTLGAAVNSQIEVLSGLQEGEKLVAEPEGRDLGGKQIAGGQ